VNILLAKRGVVAFLLIVALVLQGTTRVLAGTTGSITGTVVDASTNQPIPNITVIAASPSQSATTTSDRTGHYTFASLAPDTYTITAAAAGNHDAYSVSGVTVQAYQNITVALRQPPKLQVIGSVAARAAAALVKPGTTADVYSISATTQDKAATLGGGATLNSAWSALTSVPGVYIAPNQAGYIGAGSTTGGTLSIRGGDYNQVGYELDGVPVNRSFDNYPSGPLSSLGQQELQVYTGAPPANSESSGLSGYINQVIRTGTAPPYRQLTAAVGSPTLYNKLAFEAGGANPSRTFSYYLGAGLYNQVVDYADHFNGASLSREWGPPLVTCNSVPQSSYNAATVPSCFNPVTGADYTNGGVTTAFVLAPLPIASVAEQKVRDTVANVHFGLPRKNGNKDDIQLFYDYNYLGTIGYGSTNDLGGAALLNAIGLGAPTYRDGHQTTIPYGTVLPVGFSGGGIKTYLFPDSPGGRPVGALLPPDRRDQFVNNQAIAKLQYQRNFGTDAFFRIYGYTYYSNWIYVGPQSDYEAVFGLGTTLGPSDYELSSHTRGVSAIFSDQVTPQHLLSLQGSYVTSSSLRYNNSGIGLTPSRAIGYLVNGNDPYNGTCYSITGVAAPGCSFGKAKFQTLTMGQALNRTVVQPAPGTTCGGGPCQYVIVDGGPRATYNTVTPKFYSASLTDVWRPTERLNVNLGIRYQLYQFLGADTTNSGARTLFYNAYNLTHPTAPVFNVPSQIFTYPEFEPRAGLTYTFNPNTVVRASYGRYSYPPNTAFEQYDTLQPNAPAQLYQIYGFRNYGFTTPGHRVVPEVSNNYDLSFEHAFPGDLSIKVTPFYRKTQNQIQQFFLNQATGFVSGLNVGRQTSQGVELEVDKGDFARNGFAGRLSFTYTNSFINYNKLSTGATIIDPINTAITQYNGFTAAGGGFPCYAPAPSTSTPGAAVSCTTPGAIANPYYNAPPQPLLDANANYATYSIFPGPPTVGYIAFDAPYVATMILQYKRGPFAITPALQFSAGTRYGAPETTTGITPSLCTAGLPGSTAGDARYGYGAVGGAPYDASACDTSLVIPNQFTKKFDGIGQFVEPNQFALHLQLSYDVNRRITVVANFANIFTNCWGGSKVPFAIGGACGYSSQASGSINSIGNAYNPGNTVQPAARYPYWPIFGSYPFTGIPFQTGIEARVKI
jgi:outer membrane receptor protein involved in Fe transport